MHKIWGAPTDSLRVLPGELTEAHYIGLAGEASCISCLSLHTGKGI